MLRAGSLQDQRRSLENKQRSGTDWLIDQNNTIKQKAWPFDQHGQPASLQFHSFSCECLRVNMCMWACPIRVWVCKSLRACVWLWGCIFYYVHSWIELMSMWVRVDKCDCELSLQVGLCASLRVSVCESRSVCVSSCLPMRVWQSKWNRKTSWLTEDGSGPEPQASLST